MRLSSRQGRQEWSAICPAPGGSWARQAPGIGIFSPWRAGPIMTPIIPQSGLASKDAPDKDRACSKEGGAPNRTTGQTHLDSDSERRHPERSTEGFDRAQPRASRRRPVEGASASALRHAPRHAPRQARGAPLGARSGRESGVVCRVRPNAFTLTAPIRNLTARNLSAILWS